jgi:DNA-binding CsgD family transcriptional regulator
VVLLDHRGDVLSVNRAAEKLVNDRDGLTVVRRGLQTNRPDETARLRGLIASALTAERLSEYGAGGAMAVSRSDDRAPLNVLVAPLSSSRLVLSESRAQCVLFVGDPESEDAPDDQILRQFYGLTSAESRLAVHLMSGAGLKTAADELSVSLNTARTHLKRLFEKTQTTRQAELVRLLLRGPAGLNRPS